MLGTPTHPSENPESHSPVSMLVAAIAISSIPNTAGNILLGLALVKTGVGR